MKYITRITRNRTVDQELGNTFYWVIYNEECVIALYAEKLLQVYLKGRNFTHIYYGYASIYLDNYLFCVTSSNLKSFHLPQWKDQLTKQTVKITT